MTSGDPLLGQDAMNTRCGPLTWKFDAVAFLVGMLSAASLNFAYTFLMPTEHMRFLFGSGIIMSGVGAEYFGCALMQDSYYKVFIQINFWMLINIAVLIGLTCETPLIAIIWLLHPFWDVLHHPSYWKKSAEALGCVKVNPNQAWFPMWCAGVDIVQGTWILYHFAPEHLTFNLLQSQEADIQMAGIMI
eukprot:TRINITY_DN16626_c0_g1_i2.p1 TRINITY_DN16626_c0_g1~~TRINITY_DN16626_c0_g1_i2.p1  ORF type:complete len:189 (+),score=26.57 TRINITY_DN16626_c0_g1_i2:246-812(+)